MHFVSLNLLSELYNKPKENRDKMLEIVLNNRCRQVIPEERKRIEDGVMEEIMTGGDLFKMVFQGDIPFKKD